MQDLPTPGLPSPDASVRRAVATDAPALAAVTLASWREQYAAVVPPSAADADAATLAAGWADALASSRDAGVYVACAGPVVVGLVVVAAADDPDLGEDCAEVVDLVVRPGATREGHGSRLLAAAVDDARAAGARTLVVWCGASDDVRRAFLESAGLLPDGATRTLDDGAGGGWRQVRLAASITED